jgi:hypothetical protein
MKSGKASFTAFSSTLSLAAFLASAEIAPAVNLFFEAAEEQEMIGVQEAMPLPVQADKAKLSQTTAMKPPSRNRSDQAPSIRSVANCRHTTDTDMAYLELSRF